MAGLIPTIYNMFQPTEAERRAEFSQSLFGSPNAARTEGTMQSAEFDAEGNEINQRMTVQQPRYEGTGLFQNLPQEQIPQLQAIKQMVGSTDANIQKTGLSMLEDIQGGGEPDWMNARTFAFGAGDGQMQRGVLNEKGGLVNIGTPYDPRNPYLNTGTEFTNYNRPDSEIPINLSQAQFNKKQGDADFKFLDNYSVNVDKGESGLEAMDFLMTGLDDMANSATGWSTGLGSILKDFPTSDANAWKSMQTTVLSGLGLDKMAELKSLSSTGSTGFGALNEKELELLVSYRGKLEQANDAKTIKKVIGNMQRLIGSARKRTVRRLTNAEKRFNKLAPSRGYEETGTTKRPDNLIAPENYIDNLVDKYAD